MFYQWRSSDARELFEKTVLRRVSLVVLVILCMSPASTGRLVIDQHCLHGQYHSLFTNTTCVQSTCSRVISPDTQPYTITQEELPSASRLSMGYSISLWIQANTAENYTNRHLISLTDSRGKDLWSISINGITKRKSRTISLFIESVLNHKPNILLSVRLSSNKQQLTTWHNVLFSLHSNGQITPYFDGFVGDRQWIPVVNSGDHHIVLGANKNKHEFNLQYKDPFVFTRPLSEADAIALQQNHHLTDGATLYPHCLCPEGYTLSSINQYLCTSGNDDQQVSRIKDNTIDTIIWPQHNNQRLKRMNDDGSGDEMEDSSVITSIPFTSSVVTVFSSMIIGTSTLITSEVEGSGAFSTILSTSEVTSSIPFTSSPVSPLSSPPIISSTVFQTSGVTQSVSATGSTITFFSTVNASAVSTTEITPSSTLTPSATTGGIFSTIEVTPTSAITSTVSSAVFSTITPTFSSAAINTTTSALTSDITPSFTMSITDTVESSAINVTSAVVTTSLFSETISTIIVTSLFSPTATSSVIVTSPISPTESTTSLFTSTSMSTPIFSSAAINTTTSALTSDITPSFTMSVTDTVVSSAINVTSAVVSTSLFSETISTTIVTSLFSSAVTSSVIVTSPISPTESTTSLELFTSTSMSSVTVSPTLETIVSVVSTESLAVTVTPTSTIAPTMVTLSSVTELTSVTPLPTPTISSSIETVSSTELSTQTTSFTALPTTLFSTSSEFISPSPTTTFALDTTTSMSSAITSEFTSTIFTFTTVSPTDTTASPSSITDFTTVLLTSDTREFTPTTIPSLSSSLIISTTEIVPTMITSVLTSETLSSTVDVTSSLEATFTSSLEASPTTIGSLSTITSSFDLTSETSSPIVISTSLSTEFVPSMTTSGIVNVTSETPTSSLVSTSEVEFTTTSPTESIIPSTFEVTPTSSLVPTSEVELTTTSPTESIIPSTFEVTPTSSLVLTSEVELTTTSPTESIIPSTIEVFPTLPSSNITDFTPTSSFTVTSTSVLQSSPIVSSMFTSEVVPNSTAIETVSETLVPSTEVTNTAESTQPTLISSSLVTLTSSSVEIVSTMISIIESTVSSSFISLTTSSTVDTTTTVASSVEILTSVTSDSVFTPTTTITSDTINVTISSSFSSLQPITSTVEVTSSPSMVLSSTEFISSTISEVISSTIMLTTQTFVTSAEVTPSTIMSSSVVPTTTSPVVSPTPTCMPGTRPCDVLMACIPTTQECPTVPKAPIRISAEGGGFLIDEIKQDENNSNQYTFKFGNFITAQNEGTVNSELGSLQDSGAFEIPPRINYSSLEGHIIRNEIAPSDPIHVVVQAHNLSILSTSAESFSVVITVNGTNTNYSIQNECTITVNSGYCIGRVDLGGLNSTSSTVSISVMEKNNVQSIVDVGQVKILEIAERNINNNAILLTLPTHTIYPPDDVTVTISSIGYSVKSLLLNCSVNDSGASIMTLPKTNWSTLSINNDIANQLAISHERVTEGGNEHEEEILCMKINFKSYSTDWVEVKCQLNELLLTNRVLVDERDLNIAVLDRNNMRDSSGYIFLGNENVINYLVAYANETVLFNSAVINGELLEYDLVVKGITMTGEVVNLTDLNCTSSNPHVLQVMPDCSRVFLDGTETAGSILVAINVYYESLNTTVVLRVWYPETPVLEAEDTVLNVISNWRDPHLGCNHRYQQTLFRVFANVSDGTRTIYRLDVTLLISDILISSNESVLKVFPNATVQGVSPGTANVTGNNINLMFNVSDEPVEAVALEVLLYNNLSVAIPQVINLYEEANGTVTLTQESDRPKLLFVNVLFTDSQRMELKQSDYIVNSTCPDSIAIRGNLVHPIGNTSGYKQCVKVTLVRDEACNVTDSVEGVANVSIRLSTPMNLEIKLSTHEIVSDENISLITGISTEITLKAILHFSNGDQIDIALANETNVTTALNVRRSTEKLTLSASPEHVNSEYNITVTNSLYNNISNSTSVNVVQGITVNLSVHPYPEYNNSNSTNINHLSRIGNTDMYQQGLLKVMLTLPNGSNYIVTDRTHFEMIPENILIPSDGTISVNSNIMTDANVSVNITAQFSSLNSENVTIQVRSEPVEVKSIDVIFVSEFRGVQNSTEFVDASVTLSDNTTLLHTYERNTPLYPNLLSFSVDDRNTASVDGNTVTLLGNSLTDNYITARAVGRNNLSANKTFRCDLVAGLHDVDLGTNLSLPIAVDRGDILESPVHVNSENADLGIFELNVFYSSRELEVDKVVPGEDWATGSLVYQVVTSNENENINMVSFGGINYQGVKGKSIHVANIMFKANERGTVILNSTITLLAKADLTSELIAEVNRDSTAGSSLMVYVNEKQTRRDVSYDEPPLMSPKTEIHNHHKRQSSDSNQEILVGDLNRDGEVDLRDVNYLRHYQVESVYNFTSPAGQEILMTYNDTFDSLDVNGDGQINSLDTTELENINFDLLRVINNVTALCSYDSGVCTCTVAGELYTVDMQPSPSDDVFILVDFGSTNQSFQLEFNNTFQNASVVSYNKGDGLYGGIVLAEINSEPDKTMFVVKTNSSFSTPDIGISLIQITVDENNETSNERQSIHVKSGNIYNNTLNVDVSIPNVVVVVNIILENGYSPFINLSDCPVAIENTTSSTMTTAVSTSTAVSTTLVTTSASSLISTAVIPSLTTTILDTSSTSVVISSTSEITSTSTPPVSSAPTSSVVSSSSVETSEVSSTATPLTSATTTSSASPTATSSIPTTTITRSTSEIDSTSTSQISTTTIVSSTSEISTSSTTALSPPTSGTLSASSIVTPSTTGTSNISTPSTSTAAATTSTISSSSAITTNSASTSTGVVSSLSTTTTSSSEISMSSPSAMSITATASEITSQTSTSISASSTSTMSIPTTTTSSGSQTPTTTTTSSSASKISPLTSLITTNTFSSLTSTPTITEITTSSIPAVTTSPTDSSMTTTSSPLTSSAPTNTSGTDIASDPSSGGGGSTGAVVAVVVILVIIVTTVVVVLVVCWYRRSKKRKTYYFNPASRPSSGLSSNYWFQEEEKIEMSPIDIVPMAPSPCDEQFRDTVVVSNGIGYRNIGYASGTQRSADGGTKPGYFKSSAESSAGPPPPPYTSRHQRNSTAFDDEVNLSFHDEPISQAYLSLGLTPLSQLSPPDSQDVGFFPSLPPPIATTVDDHSIPVDGPLFIDDSRKFTKRNRRAGLETVPEQPTSPPSTKYSQGSNPLSPFQRSTQPEESLVFPSASISQDYLRTLSNANHRTASPNYGARNFGFSSQYEDDPLIDFNEYGSGYSMHVDSSPESKRNGRNLNYHGVSRDSPPDEHHSQFTRGDLRRQGVKRSRGDLSSQRSSQEMMLQQPIRKEKVYDDDDDDLTTVLVSRPTSPPGVYPPQLSDIHNFTPPVKDQNFGGSISSIPSYKEDHHATTLL